MASCECVWQSLPAIAIVEILSYLSVNDRLNCSSVCRNWRICLFNSSLWRGVKLSLTNDSLDKTKFITSRCCSFVRNLFIELNTGNSLEVKELCRIIHFVRMNKNLQILSLKPTGSHIEWPLTRLTHSFDKFVDDIEAIMERSQSLCHLSVGFNEELSEHIVSLLPKLAKKHGQHLVSLHFASVKQDPENYGIVEFSPNIFSKFCKLKHLSLDYDYLSNDLLTSMASSNINLATISINIHRIDDAVTDDMTDSSWLRLSTACPDLKVNLNVIHSPNSVMNLLTILKPSMPLTCYRQFYCSSLNEAVIDFIAHEYSTSLETIYVIDGFEIKSPNVYINQLHRLEDPFVMLAWKCQKLKHFTLIGYEILDDDLIAIARLRPQLSTLTIPSACIKLVYSGTVTRTKDQMSASLGWSWSPLDDDELHPSVFDPQADAESSYIRVLLADQAWRGRAPSGTLENN